MHLVAAPSLPHGEGSGPAAAQHLWELPVAATLTGISPWMFQYGGHGWGTPPIPATGAGAARVPAGRGAQGGPGQQGWGDRRVPAQHPLPCVSPRAGGHGAALASLRTARIRPLSPGAVPGQGNHPRRVLEFHPTHIHSYGDNSEPPPVPFSTHDSPSFKACVLLSYFFPLLFISRTPLSFSLA